MTDAQVLVARRSGLSLSQIAKQLGCSHEWVRQVCIRAEHAERLAVAPDIWFELDSYTRNGLTRYNGCAPTIESVLENYTLAELRRVPGLGETRIARLQAWLVKHGHQTLS